MTLYVVAGSSSDTDDEEKFKDLRFVIITDRGKGYLFGVKVEALFRQSMQRPHLQLRCIPICIP